MTALHRVAVAQVQTGAIEKVFTLGVALVAAWFAGLVYIALARSTDTFVFIAICVFGVAGLAATHWARWAVQCARYDAGSRL